MHTDLAAKNGWGRGRRRWVAGGECPRRRAAEPRRTSSNPAFWGLNGPVLGSRRVYAPCVNHLRHLRASVGLWAACATVQAACLAGVRCSGGFGASYGTGSWRRRYRGSVDAHQGSDSSSVAVQGGRSRGPAASRRRHSVTGSMRGCSGLLGSTGSFMEFL